MCAFTFFNIVLLFHLTFRESQHLKKMFGHPLFSDKSVGNIFKFLYL